ncbi:MAG: four helix bundle protein [Nitrospira sp.]|nr:four helix bundle protein [Nitrospira sp.]TKB72368.1 MAG: four helix bundle protein [Nitrospira sp.]
MNPIKSFEDLDVWKVGRQIRTAAISLTANIAEGYGRFHYKENIQYCRIARGSAYELLDNLITCKDLEYVSEKQYDDLQVQLRRFVQLINGYIRSIGRVGSKGTSDSDTNDA